MNTVFSLEFLERKCKACGLCIHYCPQKVFDTDISGKPVLARIEKCVGCGQCEYRCPDYAIRVHKNE